MNKDYILFRAGWMASIDAIPTEKAKAEMALAILRYAFKGEEYDGQNLFIKALIPTITASIDATDRKIAQGKINGKMGGNPLLTQKRVNPTLNPEDNPRVNAVYSIENKETSNIGSSIENNKKESNKERNALFEECWIAYRRKGSKKKAVEYWNKLSEEDQDRVLVHVKAYVESRELNYQKDFERYLRDKTFLDIVTNSKGNVIYDPNDDPAPMPEPTSKYQ